MLVNLPKLKLCTLIGAPISIVLTLGPTDPLSLCLTYQWGNLTSLKTEALPVFPPSHGMRQLRGKRWPGKQFLHLRPPPLTSGPWPCLPVRLFRITGWEIWLSYLHQLFVTIFASNSHLWRQQSRKNQWPVYVILLEKEFLISQTEISSWPNRRLFSAKIVTTFSTLA